MKIILVGYAATEAAHRLILNEKPALCCRFSDRFINNTLTMTGSVMTSHDKIRTIIDNSEISVSEEDIMELSDMGIFGGLWEFSEKNGCGIKIYLDKISILQQTIEICEYLNVNPYTYPSQGSWLIRTENAYELADFINNSETELHASVIGTETDKNDRIIINKEEVRYLTPINRLLSDEQEVRNLRYIKF